MPQRAIKVLIVDDSALIRQMLSAMLADDPGIEVVGTAPDPLVAREKIKQLNPDVVTLDIEMPRMDGLDFLNRIMTLRPTPVVMVSSLSQKGAEASLKAMELGAVDVVAKPIEDLATAFPAMRDEIVAKVRAAAGARLRRRERIDAAEPLQAPPGFRSTETVVAIGASTGGVEAITEVLTRLPARSPAIAITQHMPPAFTKAFARRLDSLCAITVAEAEDGTRMMPGHAYVAPGDRHLRVVRSGANYVCRVGGTDLVSGHCPSVDALFRSVAENVGGNAVAVILTGMGRDGAEGLAAIRQAGGRTVGQDEESSVVYGMPKAAFELGGVEQQRSLGDVAGAILTLSSERRGDAIRI
ncbi:Chemotaxis response regulator protein-glutamate methylesterase [Hartmannibacter diazotrophicus]|uniref:Protein-glutamate methylesterase/protein-glutamine glutaminase n=1 Tax=Hartmannibacter diazotrophicus TaxID=1482074 RepID=A0A2C9DEA5_9HYPH|nr:chemotaxis response regulator protein-glutamate methylesterase [Hartmannibacter diazotrophicus]SON58261.1 Chemotaxis response regulator protein-glutamate methylesterase [Hartmannibacter diazotrophicus]